MALDGIFLNGIKNELKNYIVGSKVDKIYQPSRDEIVLYMRSRTGVNRLLMSARANSSRVHLTDTKFENPLTPPMLCMLLRKHLTGAILTNIRQINLDRILFFDFDATNEIGDKVKLLLCIEIMGQYSNIILIDQNNKVIDAVKRVDISTSSVRQILPTIQYKLPPAQSKINLLNQSSSEAIEKIMSFGHKKLSSAIINSIMGVSPIVSRELVYRSCFEDVAVSELSDVQKENLKQQLENLKALVENKGYKPTIIINEDNKPIDFSFFDIKQYNSMVTTQNTENFSTLLDTFYSERDKIERLTRRSQDLRKLLMNHLERTIKKIDIQKNELRQCDDREKLRIYAELISANQYALKKGSFYYELHNYYDNDKIVKVPADPALTPLQNSQKYYKEYKKTYTAEKKLKEQIKLGEEEIDYLDSVLDELSRIDTEKELNEIRQELYDLGYVKSKKNLKKRPVALPPIKYISSEGFTILVGRNNVQNDKLTLKTAAKLDMWLHTKNFPGSHVIIVSDGKEITDLAITQAANIAVVHSKAKNSTHVPVDYTLVKNIKKPNGAKPGKVIYHVYNTIYINPNYELVEKLKNKN